MDPSRLRPKTWYWVKKPNGTIVPHLLQRVLPSDDERKCGRPAQVEMFVGSMLQTFWASQIIGPAEMPTRICNNTK